MTPAVLTDTQKLTRVRPYGRSLSRPSPDDPSSIGVTDDHSLPVIDLAVGVASKNYKEAIRYL